MLFTASSARGLILLGTLTAALERASLTPLAFAIENVVHGVAASRAAEVRGVADRRAGRFMTARPSAQGRRQNNFCCVTTRRRNCGVRRCLRPGLGVLTARPLRCGVLGFGGCVQASAGLPPGRLPVADQASAFGILAVALVRASRLILATAAFAQAEAWPRSSRPGTAMAPWLTMTAAHGRTCTPKGQPGGNALTFSSGAFANRDAGDRRQCTHRGMNQTGKETA
jgi:hypothetical protein